MYTLLAAAALAGSLAGPPVPHHAHRCLPGFAGQIENRLLATPEPADFRAVYTPGCSDLRGRVWIDRDVLDACERINFPYEPGRAAYGAVGAGPERVHVRVNNVVVTVSPWEHIEGEGLENLERARQQWLAERGYTNAVRTFVNPSRTRALFRERLEHEAPVLAPEKRGAGSGALPAPSATIRLRNPDQTGGVIKKVEAGVAGGARLVSSGETIRVSWPLGASAEVLERSVARGWTAPEQAVADARD